MRDYRIYLKDILAAIDSIDSFVAGMDIEAFETDDKTSSAVIRKFEIIGEAVKSPKPYGPRTLKSPGKRWPACVTG